MGWLVLSNYFLAMKLKVCRFGVVPEETKFRLALEERPRALSKMAVHKVTQIVPLGPQASPLTTVHPRTSAVMTVQTPGLLARGITGGT